MFGPIIKGKENTGGGGGKQTEDPSQGPANPTQRLARERQVALPLSCVPRLRLALIPVPHIGCREMTSMNLWVGNLGLEFRAY